MAAGAMASVPAPMSRATTPAVTSAAEAQATIDWQPAGVDGALQGVSGAEGITGLELTSLMADWPPETWPIAMPGICDAPLARSHTNPLVTRTDAISERLESAPASRRK